MGDFNDLLLVKDIKGGTPHSNWLFWGFQEIVTDCNLLDVPLNGHQFTWSRGREANNLLEECLDRALGNPSWYARFPNAKLLNLVALISDHSLILLETSQSVRTHRNWSFHFENHLLDRSWTSFRDFPLLERLQAIAGVLQDWGKHIALASIRNRHDLEREVAWK